MFSLVKMQLRTHLAKLNVSLNTAVPLLGIETCPIEMLT